MNLNRLAVAMLALVSAAGCRNDGPGTNKPDYVPMPAALAFSACPTKDEMNRDVADVFPDEQKVTIDNVGKAPGTFTATLSGADAARFKLDPMRTPAGIAAGAMAELPVQFSPDKKGDARATLTIDDGDATTDTVTVDLVGTGKNLPAQPTIEAALEDYATPGNFMQVCKLGSPLLNCQQAFPDTLLGDTTTLKIKLRNTGCPAIKVTGITLEKATGGADDPAFFLDSPSALPSAQNPIVMSTADGTAELELIVRFSPQSDGSGNEQRFANLTIATNDPQTPMLQLSLSGNGLQPAIYAVPSFCNFTDMNDRCGATPSKIANQAEFRVTNGGGSPVTITNAQFKSSMSSTTGTNGRFTVMTPIDGTVLMPGMSANLVVKHMDDSLFVIDQITVTASPASAGKLFLTVAGGTAPCLQTDPDLNLDYDDPAMELTTKKVTIKALAVRPGTNTPCGDLIVDDVEIAANPFFSVVEPKIAPGTKITKGQQADINIQYKKPVTGGRQAADLVIKTNDLDYGSPAFKKVLLQSKSPLNEIPLCVLKGCTPAMTDCSTMGSTQSMLVSLSQLGTTKRITLWGGDSSDPGNEAMTNKGIAEWKFNAIPPSPNVPNWSITGGNNYTTMNTQYLNLDPAVTGEYRVFLYVKDASGQQSGMACQLNVRVVQ